MGRFVFAWALLLCLGGVAYGADPIAELQNSLDHNKALRRYHFQLRVADSGQAWKVEIIDGDIKVRNLIHSGMDILAPDFKMNLLLQAGGQLVHDEVAALRSAFAELQKQSPDRKIQLTAASNTLVDQGTRYLQSGDVAKGFECYRQAAEQGIASAQCSVGAYYHRGVEGVAKKNPERSIKWLTRAAEQGVPAAMTYLGGLYLFEKDYPRDLAGGFEWTRKAAEMDFAPAQATLAYLIKNGVGTAKKDPVKAVEWLNKAMAQGDGRAMGMMAECCVEGKGVPKDFAKAQSLLQQVIDRATTDPRDTIQALNLLAWLLSTSEDARFLDGRKAVELAGKVLALVAGNEEYARYEPAIMDTLAAAYARKGQFDQAIETQETFLGAFDTIDWPPHKDKETERRKAQARLELYRKHQAYVHHPEP